MNNKIEIIKEDITNLEVDAIVNAANNMLMGGGGVDGIIHQKAGKELSEACKKLNGCATGEAKITKGYNLKAKYIIHTVAPKWYDLNEKNKEELLRKCYINSFKLAKENNLKRIAFPCLGAGIYCVPISVSAKISIEESLKNADNFDKIILVCYKESDYIYYKKYYNDLKLNEKVTKRP